MAKYKARRPAGVGGTGVIIPGESFEYDSISPLPAFPGEAGFIADEPMGPLPREPRRPTQRQSRPGSLRNPARPTMGPRDPRAQSRGPRFPNTIEEIIASIPNANPYGDEY